MTSGWTNEAAIQSHDQTGSVLTEVLQCFLIPWITTLRLWIKLIQHEAFLLAEIKVVDPPRDWGTETFIHFQTYRAIEKGPSSIISWIIADCWLPLSLSTNGFNLQSRWRLLTKSVNEMCLTQTQRVERRIKLKEEQSHECCNWTENNTNIDWCELNACCW